MQKSGLIGSWNIQNPSIIPPRRIFRTLSCLWKQVYPVQPWYIQNPTHIQNPLKDLRWSVTKIVKNNKYLFKVLFLGSLASFQIRPSLNTYSWTCRVNSQYVLLNTYSWTCRVNSQYVLYETYSKPCHIQNSGIFRTQDIFRTLLRYILAYSERCGTLAYWESCHIQKFGIFRILTYLGPEAYWELLFI